MRNRTQFRCLAIISLFTISHVSAAAPQSTAGKSPAAGATAASPKSFEEGFRLLYELKFHQARAVFRDREKAEPGNPLGAAAEAASYLFEEFSQRGVLTSKFFLDDDRLLNGIEGEPDPKLRDAFLRANRRALDLARRRLQANARDVDALYVLTISTGMQSNYTGLIEKHHLESLKMTREAGSYARKLLEVKPDTSDVYVALGATNYIVGCLPTYKKVFLFFGGIRGNRQEGMKQLSLAAKDGHFLRPYAKILLALAALREKQPNLARTHLQDLAKEFPQNPLFAEELALLGREQAEGGGAPHHGP